MSQLGEYRHVVPRYPPFRDLALFHTKNRPKIKLYFLPRGRKRPHLSSLGAFVRCPYGHEVSLSNEVCESLNGIRKHCCVLPAKVLKLFKTPDIEIRGRLAMTDNIRS